MTKPRIPKLTKAMIRESIAAMPARMAEMERREEARRCLTGEYAPPTGTCRVCNCIVQAEIKFPYTGVLGGPPTSAFVSRWVCDGCGLVYARNPGKKPESIDE
jgi:hypothetical protein